MRSAKAVAASGAQLVLSLSGSQDVAIQNAGQARTVVEDLLRAAKGGH